VLIAYLVALALAVTAGILSDVAALRQQRLILSIALALLTLLALIGVALTLPLMVTSAVVEFPAPDIVFAFAPLISLLLAALGSLLLTRSRPGAQEGRSGGTDSAAPTPAALAAGEPPHRLALLSLLAALYTPVAVLLAVLLSQLALAASPRVCDPAIEHCPPVESPLTPLLTALSAGLLVLILPAVGVAVVSSHVALSRFRHHAAPTRWRTVAWWGLMLGYATFPVLMAFVAWAVLTGTVGGE
jgi:hypothetical protein